MSSILSIIVIDLHFPPLLRHVFWFVKESRFVNFGLFFYSYWTFLMHVTYWVYSLVHIFHCLILKLEKTAIISPFELRITIHYTQTSSLLLTKDGTVEICIVAIFCSGFHYTIKPGSWFTDCWILTVWQIGIVQVTEYPPFVHLEFPGIVILV